MFTPSIAALIVLLWPGSLPVLGLSALGTGILSVACLALIWRAATRRSIRSPDAHD